ncbi:helix-turn-helix domain-containing protein [Aquicoccus sp. SCR17]|nr:helix-turn-helix domain-containing protein [Carideicomes alvinocaridis]
MDAGAQYLYGSNMSDAARIQTYNLFGEQGDLPDVVHCETIAARSRLHDWELGSHRHARLHQVLCLTRGGGEAELEGRSHPLRAGRMINVPVGLVHGFRFTPGTEGHVVTLPTEMVDEVLEPSEGLGRVLSRAAVLPAPGRITRLMAAIAEAHAGRAFARAQELRALAALLLGLVAREMAAEQGAEAAPVPALLTRFEALLEAHFAEHWSVARYADALAVSPTHLSRVTRAATGRPATALIEERLVREARRSLVYTNLPVQRIAFELGFNDPAYFSRVFARATGRSPRAFRADLAARGG